MRLSKKLAIVVLGTVGAIAASTTAWAFWTTNGSGTGSVSTGTITSLVVNQTSTITGLYPGGPAQTLSGNFNNANAGKAYVSSVSASLAGVVGGTDSAKPACAVADFDLAGTAPVNQEVTSGNGQGSWSGLTIALKDTGANQDNCKNATLNLAYTANP